MALFPEGNTALMSDSRWRLLAKIVLADPTPVTGSDRRITEEGEGRVTEEGDRRVLES